MRRALARRTLAGSGAGPRPALLLAPLALLSCATPGPIIESHTYQLTTGALRKVAVVPFYPLPQLTRSLAPGGVSAADAADLVGRFMVEAFRAAGVPVVAPSDLMLSFEAQGTVIPRQDPKATARVAASDFGATSVLLGEVLRYREREGGEFGARKPASVWFEVQLYSAPEGERLLSARFKQTQPSLSENVLLAHKYPGGGTRWLSAAELTRWGADEFVASIPQGLR